jgi:hypothetical protein
MSEPLLPIDELDDEAVLRGEGDFLTPGAQLGDALFGSVHRIQGGFGGALGQQLGALLLERLRVPTRQSQEFIQGTDALRESTGQAAAGARQRASDRAIATGNIGSGAVAQELGDVNRAELEAFSSGVRDIFLALEARKTADVLPYLSGLSQEKISDQAAAVQVRAQNEQAMEAILGMFSFGV